MIGFLLAAGLLSGAGSAGTPPDPAPAQQPAGKRHKQTYAEAYAEHERRRAWLESLEPEAKAPAKRKPLRQAAQDAPAGFTQSQPRTAEPVSTRSRDEDVLLLLLTAHDY